MDRIEIERNINELKRESDKNLELLEELAKGVGSALSELEAKISKLEQELRELKK